MNVTTARQYNIDPSSAAAASALGLTVAIVAACLTSPMLEPWARMWLTAITLLFTLKLLVYGDALRKGCVLSGPRAAAYFSAWPGLDPEAFAASRRAEPLPLRYALKASACCAGGAYLLAYQVPRVVDHAPLAAAWLGMIGLVLLLHFGTFALAAFVLRRLGFAVEPLMDRPVAARSLADFWGRRWNRAFTRATDRLVFRPTARRYGTTAGVWASFLFSGLIHDVVISLPARGGYGLPTLYFLLQAAGLLATRSTWGRRLRLHAGPPARIFALLLIVGPLGWAFHVPFAMSIVLPFLRAIGCY